MIASKLGRRGFSEDRIGEVTQETFRRVLAAVRKRSIKDAEALGAFVNTTSERVVVGLYRQETREPQGESEEVHSRDPLPDALLILEEHCSLVRRILEAMPERDRTALRLLYFEDVEKDEICRRLGVDRAYLRVLLHRARVSFESQWKQKT